MGDDRDVFWAELQTAAERLLEHAREVEPKEIARRYHSELRLWHYPSFGPHVSWTIFRRGRKKDVAGSPNLVREVTWDQFADRRWVYDPAEALRIAPVNRPIIRLREATLPEGPLEKIMGDGAALSVPLLGFPGTLGLDGERWGLENYQFSPRIRIDWFCDGPVAWRHFIDWVGALREFLCRCLDEAG